LYDRATASNSWNIARIVHNIADELRKIEMLENAKDA
jgi:hypothetical protein